MVGKELIAICFVVALIAGIVINNFFIKRPIKFLVKKANISAIRFSSQSKPIFGGITFFVLFILVVIVSIFVSETEIYYNPEFYTLLLAVILGFFMGLADDIINTPPSFKFIIQLICSLIFIINGLYIHISPNEWVNYTITILWVLGIMNSINMLDNMDAVTSLTSLSIFAGIIIHHLLGYAPGGIFSVLVLTGICAGLISFLIYNWHPAKMYMGDNGSQLLGVVLAFAGIKYFWNAVPIAELDYAYNSKQFVIIALAFVVPLSDTTTVTINRLLRRQSPFVGGKDHTTHHLFYLGIPTPWVGIILFILNAIGVFLAFKLINSDQTFELRNIWLYALYPIVVFLSLYINTKISKQK